MDISSQITFLYFKDLTEPAVFFENVLELELVNDQGFARIYRVAGGSFLGIVDETKGSLKAQDKNAVLLTLVVDDVEGWHVRLKAAGLEDLSEIKRPELAPVKCFFFKGPGGYDFEIQTFLDPAVQELFRK